MSNFQRVAVTLPSGAYHSQFKLRIRSIGSSGPNDDWFVDNVKLQSVSGTSVPGLPLLSFCVEPDVTKSTDAFRLDDIPTLPFYLPPQGQISLALTFMPEQEVDHEAFVVIRSSSPNPEPRIVEATGQGIPDYLLITPDNEIVFEGHPGGPYMPTYNRYTLTNQGPVAVNWEIVDPNWVLANPSTGSLACGESVQVEFCASANADLLPKGIHLETLRFRDVTTGKTQNRTAKFVLSTNPKIWYDPTSIESRIPYRSTDHKYITLRNTGDEPLQFNISSQYAPGNPAGEQLTRTASKTSEKQILPMAEQMPYAPEEVIVRFAPMTNGESLSQEQQENILLNVITGAEIIESFELVPDLVRVKLPAGMQVQDALNALNESDNVLYAEPNYEFNANDIIPNDLYWSQLWGMRNIAMPKAWETTTGSNDVIVAVIDTGADYNHVDLQKNMWVNLAEQNGSSGYDDDHNGYIDDIHGYDFVNRDGNPMDDHYHGTHVSGTIGAVGNNATGVAGVCWNVKIMPIKFLNYAGNGLTTDAILSVQYATNMNADIMSNSWGGGAYSQSLGDAIAAAHSKGILFIAAAGNNGSNNDYSPHYPSSYDVDNVIAVMATDSLDRRSVWPSGNSSSYGFTSVDIGAPGSDIVSTATGNSYTTLSGTSMATPHVSGAAALIWARNPWMSSTEVKSLLLSSVDKTLSGLCVSEGRLNVAKALEQTGTGWLTYSPTSGVIQPGEELNIEVSLNGTTPPGIYNAQLKIMSNDLLNPEINIPVMMEVANANYCTELFDSLDNDLSGRTLIFKPQIDGSYAGCAVPASAYPVDPSGGTVISLADDDYEEISFADRVFEFHGQSYNKMFVSSNGYITFETGDYNNVETLENHFAIPRIAALFDDLDPSAGGTVSWKKDAQKLTVTFDQVCEYNKTTPNSFQIELHYTGMIRITLLQISAKDGLAGLSDGQGVSQFYVETDFSSYPACSFPGDIDEDLFINLNDFSTLARYWLTEYSEPIAGPELFLDALSSVSYGCNDGTDLFTGNWQEIGESDGPAFGYIMVAPENASNNRIQFTTAKLSNGFGLMREANLNGAESAVLSFEWITAGDVPGKLQMDVDISTDGTNWTNVASIVNSSQIPQLQQIDITAYISATTKIRLMHTFRDKGVSNFYVDNFRIQCQSSSTQSDWNASCDMNDDLVVDLVDLLMFCESWIN